MTNSIQRESLLPPLTLPTHRVVTGNAFVRALEITVLFVLMLCYWAQYGFIGNVVIGRGVNYIHFLISPLDQAIPFSASWSLFYSSALFVPFLFSWLIFIQSRFDLLLFYRMLLTCLLTLTIHFTFYLLLPTCTDIWNYPGFSTFWQQLKLPGLLHDNARYILSITSPWNSFPSYHIGSGWIVLRYTMERLRLRFLRYFFLIWFMGMCIGALTLKVHTIADGLAAILISECVYQLFRQPVLQKSLSSFLQKTNRKKVIGGYLAVILIAAPLVIYQLNHITPILISQYAQ